MLPAGRADPPAANESAHRSRTAGSASRGRRWGVGLPHGNSRLTGEPGRLSEHARCPTTRVSSPGPPGIAPAEERGTVSRTAHRERRALVRALPCSRAQVRDDGGGARARPRPRARAGRSGLLAGMGGTAGARKPRADPPGGRGEAPRLARSDRVRVRLLHDWPGALGHAIRRFWRGMRLAGVEVRRFNLPRLDSPFGWLSRDHRKAIAVDGWAGFVTGLRAGQRWVRDPARGIEAWRGTGVAIRGPAVADPQRTASRRAGWRSRPARSACPTDDSMR